MDITTAAINQLSDYLKSKLPPEFEVLNEFPGPNSKLEYPCLSLTPARAVVRLKYPELVSYTDKEGTVATVVAMYKVADVDIPIQLDSWFLSNDQRKYYVELLTTGLIQNPARSSDINLKLVGHHDVHANYQIDDTINFQDTSDEALVSEYRARYDLLCTTELLVSKDEYKLLHLYIHAKVYSSNPDKVEVIQIF